MLNILEHVQSLFRQPVQDSRREEMKAWMRVVVTESDRYGRSLEMFLRWKKAFLEMDLM